MPSSISPPKNPRLVDAGREGARRRWGVPRVIRLDDFDSDERAAIVAAIEAKRAARRAHEAAIAAGLELREAREA